MTVLELINILEKCEDTAEVLMDDGTTSLSRSPKVYYSSALNQVRFLFTARTVATALKLLGYERVA